MDDMATSQSIRLDSPNARGASTRILDPGALAQSACMLRRASRWNRSIRWCFSMPCGRQLSRAARRQDHSD
jgi:hypothetical protein